MRRNRIWILAALTLCLIGWLSLSGELGGWRSSASQTIAQVMNGQLEFSALSASFAPRRPPRSDDSGMIIRLRDADPVVATDGGQTVAQGTPLDPKRLKALFDRLPSLEEQPEDRSPFEVRAGTPPPPLTGSDVSLPFPPPGGETPTPIAPEGPLRVTRYSPVGEIPLAGTLNITFSEPMVAVGLHDAAAKFVPARMTPEPEGRWRWLGTQTLVFEPTIRFPAATNYRVSVPKGTRSASGNRLEEEIEFEFATPPPNLVSTYPRGDSVGLEPVLFMEFDQRVDAEALLEYVQLKGRKNRALRIATAEEISGDEEVKSLVDNAEPGRWIAFKPNKPLRRGRGFEVVAASGTPSAEGGRTTEEDQRFDFSTYGKLRIEDYTCSRVKKCQPGGYWWVRFNNPLDGEQEIDLEIEPAIKREEVSFDENLIRISGLVEPSTKYRVTIPGSIRDQFQQTLGDAEAITIRTGPAPDLLDGPAGPLVTIDPFGPARLSLISTNNEELSVRVHRVEPEDWHAFQVWNQNDRWAEDFGGGQLVYDEWVKVDDVDRETRVDIDLQPHLHGKNGHLLVRVESRERLTARKLLADEPNRDSAKFERERRRSWARLPGLELVYWAQITELGITSIVDHKTVSTWVTALRGGAGIAGAEVSFDPPIAAPATTDSSGLVQQAFGGSMEVEPLLIARKGGDSALLPQTYLTYIHETSNSDDRLLWYEFDDRGLYQPGEEVSLKGWLRSFNRDRQPKLELPNAGIDRVEWGLLGPRGATLDEGTASVGELGGFEIIAKIPVESELGGAHFSVAAIENGERIEYSVAHHPISIQEFRRPEFEVSSNFESDDHLVGDTAVVNVSAKYYSGGGLSTAPALWRVRVESGHYVPPNHDAYQFGGWFPWWTDHHWGGSRLVSETFTGTTDADGSHRLAIDLISLEEPRPVVVHAQASIQDRNRQSWSSGSQTLVHPAELYVGLKASRTFVQVGEAIDVDSVVVNLAGDRVSGTDVELRIEEPSGIFQRQSNHDEPGTVIAECTRTSADEPSTCRFSFEKGGSYRVVATIEDAAGRRNESELRFWVAGASAPVSRSVDHEFVQMIPDRKEYQPGDIAEILVQAPFYPAEGLMFLAQNGVVATERFRIDGPAHTLQVPIKEQHIAGVEVAVELVGVSRKHRTVGNEAARERVAFAGGSIGLSVPPRARSLSVQVLPRRQSLEPGGETEIDLRVVDANGEAAQGAELAVVVVDESVLALAGYELPDPLDVFYSSNWPGIFIQHQRSNVSVEEVPVGESPIGLMRTASSKRRGDLVLAAFDSSDLNALGASDVAELASFTPNMEIEVELRSDFAPLALFEPSITTDEDGRAVVPVKLPHSLTRYRIMAVAVSGAEYYGKGESQITARLPLMARPSPPRFLNFGDRFELPVLVQNQTDEALEVDVAVRSANATFGVEPNGANSAGTHVTVPANDRVEVRFPASPESAGDARFQVVAASGTTTDAASFDFPVWTPATSEAFATYGVIDEDAIAQPIAAPEGAWPQFGGLEVTTSSTQLQALTDAVLYLNTYEFECSEQVSSRIMSVVALGDVLDAFGVEGMPTPAALNSRVEADLVKLAALQNHDGGFGFWRNGEKSWPYLTIHVGHAIARAKAEGFGVPGPLTGSLAYYLASIDRHIPPKTSVRSANALRAYALFVRNLMGDSDPRAAAKLAQHEDLSIESMGWLLPILKSENTKPQLDQLLRRLTNLATETAAGAHFVTRYTDGAHLLLHSARRADGIVLAGLISSDPENDLIPKLVRGLLDHRKKGRWSNTQENVFILLALRDYFDRYESEVPDFAARFWLGDAYAGEHGFKGRSTDRVQLDIPMSRLLEQPPPTPLTISKEGVGRLYYRVGMRYAPKSLELAAADYGFAVEREYEAVDDPEDVSRDEDGTWHIKAGARVGVRVTMMNPMRRYHVALVDPLPAGLEPINPALATSEQPPPTPNEDEPKYGWWWYGPWYEHQNLRDERVEAFTSLLREGVHTYRYFARATTPGEFVAPPARAEEMYHPETFGRSASVRVVVK